jgi:glycerol-3-phosphate dehydrogenase
MSTPYDLIVVGGGINGAGIARDAVGRGAKVLLLEARDLASGTSSASTKLIHGGLRYLEYAEFRLVREALREREVLWRIAPHIVRPLRFVLPWTPKSMGGLRPRWQLKLGLTLYDHLGGHESLPKAKAIELAEHPAGAALDPAIASGFEYSDLWDDDARLVALTALDAHERGAEIRTRTPVTALRREGDSWIAETSDGSFAGRAMVNAAGPGADAIDRLAGLAPSYTLRRVRGSHIVTRKLFDHSFAYIFQLPDGRIVFAIPYEDDFTLIGTTDRDHDGPLTHVEAAEDEIAYLLEAVNKYFRKDVTRDQVVWTYAGVRALVDDGSGKPEAATRGYRLPMSKPEEGAPMLGVFGGKITSYRHLAQSAVDELARRVPALKGRHWTAHAPLPGGDFSHLGQADLIAMLRRDYPFLSMREATRIGRSYGTRAPAWLGRAKTWFELGRHFGVGLSEAEINYLSEVEWAECAEDVLWRRSKLGLHMDERQRREVAEFMGS